jgi:hypothetical protein
MHANDLVGFLYCVDDLKFAAYRLTAHLEHASQPKYDWLRSHNHLLFVPLGWTVGGDRSS